MIITQITIKVFLNFYKISSLHFYPLNFCAIIAKTKIVLCNFITRKWGQNAKGRIYQKNQRSNQGR